MGGIRVAKKITTFERAVLKKVWIQRFLKFLELKHWDTNDKTFSDSVTWNGKPTTELNEDEMMDELIKEYGRRN
jgi:hypothetical protein